MTKPMLAGVIAGVILATAGATLAGYQALNGRADEPAFAEVINVDPITRDVEKPRQVCREVPVTQPAQPRDEKRIAGTAIGAVVGGLIANQAVKGDKRELATAAGAAAGGIAGNQVQKKIQEKQTVTDMRQECNTVTDVEQQVVAYNVKYRLGDEVGTVEMQHKPGATIPVENGELVIEGR